MMHKSAALSLVLLLTVIKNVCANSDHGIFKKVTHILLQNTTTNQKNYGIAVSDVDHDGNLDFIVAGFSGSNFVFRYDSGSDRLVNIAVKSTPFENLMDIRGQAIGVCACDIDGDGNEEIYFLNTNQAFSGTSAYGDKLFKWRNGKYVDIYSDEVNSNVTAKNYAGRSVACIDHDGDGKYGIAIATYAQNGIGNIAVIAMNEGHRDNNVSNGEIVLQNIARDVGLEKSTGGRAIAVGPILSTNGQSDIFFGNEGNRRLGNSGNNFLFKNHGNGTYFDMASDAGVTDSEEAVRGVALADLNQDGKLDIIYGNWDGPHRIFIQQKTSGIQFKNIAPQPFAAPSLVRTVLVADFNNDGLTEIFMNNIKSYDAPQPNKLFQVEWDQEEEELQINELDIGDAKEPHGHGTGAAYSDIDHDGILELLISHGEDKAQPLDIYKAFNSISHRWIRVLPHTKYGAPARGATVWLSTEAGEELMQVIDSGSGYLCQMEPVAHFGLGPNRVPNSIKVQWQDGEKFVKNLQIGDINKVFIIKHPFHQPNIYAQKTIVNATFTTEVKHEEL